MLVDRHEVSVLLDKLTLEMLQLMEEKVRSEVELENITKNGHILLAKSRYVAGQQNVSALQLPTENTPDFNALSSVEKVENETGYDYNLVSKTPDDSNDLIDPIKWFGILVPPQLRQVQGVFQTAITYIISCLNVQSKLLSVLNNIDHLKKIKLKLTPEE